MEFSHLPPLQVVGNQNYWKYWVGEFQTRLNNIANAFLMQGQKYYPNGVEIRLYSAGEVAADLGKYCRAMRCTTKEQRAEACAELYDLCSKSKIGFTKHYWWTIKK